MADEWKYGQQSLGRTSGFNTPYRENAPLMRPIGGDLLSRGERREIPVSARIDERELAAQQAAALGPSQQQGPAAAAREGFMGDDPSYAAYRNFSNDYPAPGYGAPPVAPMPYGRSGMQPPVAPPQGQTRPPYPSYETAPGYPAGQPTPPAPPAYGYPSPYGNQPPYGSAAPFDPSMQRVQQAPLSQPVQPPQAPWQQGYENAPYQERSAQPVQPSPYGQAAQPQAYGQPPRQPFYGQEASPPPAPPAFEQPWAGQQGMGYPAPSSPAQPWQQNPQGGYPGYGQPQQQPAQPPQQPMQPQQQPAQPPQQPMQQGPFSPPLPQRPPQGFAAPTTYAAPMMPQSGREEPQGRHGFAQQDQAPWWQAPKATEAPPAPPMRQAQPPMAPPPGPGPLQPWQGVEPPAHCPAPSAYSQGTHPGSFQQPAQAQAPASFATPPAAPPATYPAFQPQAAPQEAAYPSQPALAQPQAPVAPTPRPMPQPQPQLQPRPHPQAQPLQQPPQLQQPGQPAWIQQPEQSAVSQPSAPTSYTPAQPEVSPLVPMPAPQQPSHSYESAPEQGYQPHALPVQDAFEEDDPVVQAMPPFSMPAPATVPLKEEDTGDGYRTPRGLMALLCVLLMISTACAFFFTGLADGLLKKVGIPTWSEMAEQMNEPAAEAPPQASASLLEAQTLTPSADEEASVVALEQVLTQSQGGIAPASSNLPSLSSFTVTPPESSPNDTLLFTLQTSAKVIDVKLYTISLQPIPIKDTNKAPMGDGMTWQLTTTLTQPYEGEVRAILKYGENLWADGLLRCSVSVKATATAEVPQETEKSTEESTTEKTIAPAPGNEKPIAENSSSQNAPLERPPFDNPTLKTPVLAQ